MSYLAFFAKNRTVYKLLLKPLLFRLSPEKAHSITLVLLQMVLSTPLLGNWFRRYYRVDHPMLRREVLGLSFPNPVGLAAGFDKDGKYYRDMAALGFGFIELGTVTPKGQVGNPQPRLFRLPADEGLINRMGFNNEGVQALVERLKYERPEGIVIGGNIGKNKITPNEEANNDYVTCFEALFPYVDYFVVNVSSPNTPNLRALQDREPLTRLLTELQTLNRAQPTQKPILLKIAPDLTETQLDEIVEIVQQTRISGIIATNTTISRDGLQTPAEEIAEIGAGGLSGSPVRQRSTEVIRYLNEQANGQLFIIGVGGITSPEDAIEKLEAGASLVQVYSGLIYEGPSLVKKINQAILQRNKAN